MSTIIPLTESEVRDYLASLNLSDANSTDSQAIRALLQLERSTFIDAISAAAKGIIKLSAILTLPSVNELTVGELLDDNSAVLNEIANSYSFIPNPGEGILVGTLLTTPNSNGGYTIIQTAAYDSVKKQLHALHVVGADDLMQISTYAWDGVKNLKDLKPIHTSKPTNKLGHQTLGLQYINGVAYFWSIKAVSGKQVARRFQYVPGTNAEIFDVQDFVTFDSTKFTRGGAWNGAISPSGRYAVFNTLNATTRDVTLHVFETDVFTTPGDYSKKYFKEIIVPTPYYHYMQDIAIDDNYIYIYEGTGDQVLPGHLRIISIATGKVVLFDDNLVIGMQTMIDYMTKVNRTTKYYEPEGLVFLPSPSGAMRLNFIIATSRSLTVGNPYYQTSVNLVMTTVPDNYTKTLVAARKDKRMNLRYKEEFLPATIDMQTFVSACVGSNTVAVQNYLMQYDTYAIKLAYDPTGNDPTKFKNLAEAQRAYSRIVNMTEVQQIITRFRTMYTAAYNSNGTTNFLPKISSTTATKFSKCIVVNQLSKIISNFAFLYQPNWNIDDILEALLSNTHRNVPVTMYSTIMDSIYDQMRSSDVTSVNPNGWVGVAYMLNNTKFPVMSETSDMKTFYNALIRIKHLPEAYGMEIPAARLEHYNRLEAYLKYLDNARALILELYVFIKYKFENTSAEILLLEEE